MASNAVIGYSSRVKSRFRSLPDNSEAKTVGPILIGLFLGNNAFFGPGDRSRRFTKGSKEHLETEVEEGSALSRQLEMYSEKNIIQEVPPIHEESPMPTT